MVTREEHLAQCKQRALECVERGDLQEAFTSMAAGVEKHPETEHHRATNKMGLGLLEVGSLHTPGEMRAWINGYN